MVLTCIEVYCGDPPTVDYATVEGLESRDPDTGLFTYGSVLKFQCLDDRRFEDGHVTKHVQCVLHGVWDQTHLTCGCKSAIALHYL